jgi:hypothetical protein
VSSTYDPSPALSYPYFGTICIAGRYVNHNIGLVYTIPGAVTLFYRIYFLLGLMQPFDRGVVEFRFGFYISCRIFCPIFISHPIPLNRARRLNVQPLSLLLAKSLCQPRPLVGIIQSRCVVVLFYRICLTWIDIKPF